MLRVKRGLSLVVVLILIVSLVIGCGQSTDNKQNEKSTETKQAADATVTSQPKPVTITVSNWPAESNAEQYALYEKIAKQVNGKYPYITVKGDEWAYEPQSFLAKAASGTLPTLYVSYFTDVAKILASEYAADMTDYLKKYGYLDAGNPDMYKICEKDGKYYGVVKEAYVVGMMQNVKLFKEAGLVDEKGNPKKPATYDELLEYAKVIKAKTGKPGLVLPTKDHQGGWVFMNIAWSYGAEFEKLVNGKWKAAFNSPEAVAALQYIKDLKWKHNVLTDNALINIIDAMQPFATDQVAMSFGHWDPLPQFVCGVYKMDKKGLVMSPVPAGPKGRFSLTGGGLFMAADNATPDQLDAAFKFLEFQGTKPPVSDEATMKDMEDKYKAIQATQIIGPDMHLIWKQYTPEGEALLKKYTNVDMDAWKDYVESPKNTTMKFEEPYNAQELYGLLDTAIQFVLTDKNADPKTVLDKVANEFQTQYLDKIK